MEKTISFTIKDGKLKFDAQGFQGQGCDKATKFLQHLGESETHQKLELGAPSTERGLHELS